MLRYWRLVLFVLGIIILAGGLIWGGIYFFSSKKGEVKNYQVLVSVRDEKSADPVEDKKSSMKMGYVIGVYPEDHEWSITEKVSYLILKMKLHEKEAQELTQSIEKDIDIKTLPKEQQDSIKEQKKSGDYQPMKETISVRAYKINLGKIGFSDPNSLLNGQPFGDKTFDWGVVEKAD